MKFILSVIILGIIPIVLSCDTTTCYSLGGDCNSNNTCVCKNGWITYGNNGLNCDYQQKDWLTALLLQIFLGGFGAANFYTNNIKYAIPQLLIGISGLFVPCILGCVMCCRRKGKFVGLSILITFIVLCSLVTIAWWIADVVRYATNVVPDANNIPLYKN